MVNENNMKNKNIIKDIFQNLDRKLYIYNQDFLEYNFDGVFSQFINL